MCSLMISNLKQLRKQNCKNKILDNVLELKYNLSVN